MVIEKPGWVTHRILMLGRKESSVYILKGEGEYALLGGGMTYIIPDVIKQLKDFNVDEKKIRRIVIHHSHFDHCGIVPFFKKRWPWIKITASARAKELLDRSDVVERIEFLNRMLLTEHGLESQGMDLKWASIGITVDEVVKDGDVLTCGDLQMKVIDVPGHSSCSIAIYVTEEKAMFGSDAGGVPFGDKIFTAANSNFDKYQDGLQKMDGYEIEIYLPEHFGARTGEDGRNYLKKSKVAAAEARAVLEASYAKTRDVKQSTKEVTDRFMEWVPEGFMPRDIIALVIGQMMRYIARSKQI